MTWEELAATGRYELCVEKGPAQYRATITHVSGAEFSALGATEAVAQAAALVLLEAGEACPAPEEPGLWYRLPAKVRA